MRRNQRSSSSHPHLPVVTVTDVERFAVAQLLGRSVPGGTVANRTASGMTTHSASDFIVRVQTAPMPPAYYAPRAPPTRPDFARHIAPRHPGLVSNLSMESDDSDVDDASSNMQPSSLGPPPAAARHDGDAHLENLSRSLARPDVSSSTQASLSATLPAASHGSLSLWDTLASDSILDLLLRPSPCPSISSRPTAVEALELRESDAPAGPGGGRPVQQTPASEPVGRGHDNGYVPRVPGVKPYVNRYWPIKSPFSISSPRRSPRHQKAVTVARTPASADDATPAAGTGAHRGNRTRRALTFGGPAAVDARLLASSNPKGDPLAPSKDTVLRPVSELLSSWHNPSADCEVAVHTALVDSDLSPDSVTLPIFGAITSMSPQAPDRRRPVVPPPRIQPEVVQHSNSSPASIPGPPLLAFNTLQNAFIDICRHHHVPNTYQSQDGQYTPTILLSFYAGSRFPPKASDEMSHVVRWQRAAISSSEAKEAVVPNKDAVDEYITYEPPYWHFDATSKAAMDVVDEKVALNLAASDDPGDRNEFFSLHIAAIQQADRLLPANHTLYLFDVLFDLGRISRRWHALLSSVPLIVNSVESQLGDVMQVDEWIDGITVTAASSMTRVKRQYGRRGEKEWRNGQWISLKVAVLGEHARMSKGSRPVPLQGRDIWLWSVADAWTDPKIKSRQPYPDLLCIPAAAFAPCLTTADEEMMLMSYLHRANTVKRTQSHSASHSDTASESEGTRLFPSDTADPIADGSALDWRWYSSWPATAGSNASRAMPSVSQVGEGAKEAVTQVRSNADRDVISSKPGIVLRALETFIPARGGLRMLDTQLGGLAKADDRAVLGLSPPAFEMWLFAGAIMPPKTSAADIGYVLLVDDCNRLWVYNIPVHVVVDMAKTAEKQKLLTEGDKARRRRKAHACITGKVIRGCLWRWVMGRRTEVYTAMQCLVKHPLTLWYAHPGCWPADLLQLMHVVNNVSMLTYKEVGPATERVEALFNIGNQRWCRVGSVMSGRCGFGSLLCAKQDGRLVPGDAKAAMLQADDQRRDLDRWYEGLSVEDKHGVHLDIWHSGELDEPGGTVNTFDNQETRIKEQVKKLLKNCDVEIGRDILSMWSQREKINVLVVQDVHYTSTARFASVEGGEQLTQPLPRLQRALQLGKPFVVLQHWASYVNHSPMPEITSSSGGDANRPLPQSTAHSTASSFRTSGHFEVLVVYASSSEREERHYRSLFRSDDPVYEHLVYLSKCNEVGAAPRDASRHELLADERSRQLLDLLSHATVPGFAGRSEPAPRCVAQDAAGDRMFDTWVASRPGVWKDRASHRDCRHDEAHFAPLHIDQLLPIISADTVAPVTSTSLSTDMQAEGEQPTTQQAKHVSSASSSPPTVETSTAAAVPDSMPSTVTVPPLPMLSVLTASRTPLDVQPNAAAAAVAGEKSAVEHRLRLSHTDPDNGRRTRAGAAAAAREDEIEPPHPPLLTDTGANVVESSNSKGGGQSSIVKQYFNTHRADILSWWSTHSHLQLVDGKRLYVGPVVDIFRDWLSLRGAVDAWVNGTKGKSKKKADPPIAPHTLQLTGAYLSSVGQHSEELREEYEKQQQQLDSYNDAKRKTGATRKKTASRVLKAELPWVKYPLRWVDNDGKCQAPVFGPTSAARPSLRAEPQPITAGTKKRGRPAAASSSPSDSELPAPSGKRKKQQASKNKDAASMAAAPTTRHPSSSQATSTAAADARTSRATKNSEKVVAAGAAADDEQQGSRWRGRTAKRRLSVQQPTAPETRGKSQLQQKIAPASLIDNRVSLGKKKNKRRRTRSSHDGDDAVALLSGDDEVQSSAGSQQRRGAPDPGSGSTSAGQSSSSDALRPTSSSDDQAEQRPTSRRADEAPSSADATVTGEGPPLDPATLKIIADLQQKVSALNQQNLLLLGGYVGQSGRGRDTGATTPSSLPSNAGAGPILIDPPQRPGYNASSPTSAHSVTPLTTSDSPVPPALQHSDTALQMQLMLPSRQSFQREDHTPLHLLSGAIYSGGDFTQPGNFGLPLFHSQANPMVAVFHLSQQMLHNERMEFDRQQLQTQERQRMLQYEQNQQRLRDTMMKAAENMMSPQAGYVPQLPSRLVPSLPFSANHSFGTVGGVPLRSTSRYFPSAPPTPAHVQLQPPV